MKIQDLLKQTKPCWKYAVFNSKIFPRGWLICKNKPFIRGCGWSAKHGVVLHVDHIIPLSKDWSKRLDKDNLQVLCEDCNIGKSNKDSIDWR